MPHIGYIPVHDIQTGEYSVLETRKKNLNTMLQERINAQNTLFAKYGIDYFDVTVDKPFIQDLIHFFRLRMMQ